MRRARRDSSHHRPGEYVGASGYFPKRRGYAKPKTPPSYKLHHKDGRTLSFRPHGALVTVTLTAPGKKRQQKRLDVTAARGLYAARRRDGWSPVSTLTCECPAYPWPHRQGSGCCGHPERAGCPYRRPGRHRDEARPMHRRERRRGRRSA